MTRVSMRSVSNERVARTYISGGWTRTTWKGNKLPNENPTAQADAKKQNIMAALSDGGVIWTRCDRLHKFEPNQAWQS
jgi:hypothetical protein